MLVKMPGRWMRPRTGWGWTEVDAQECHTVLTDPDRSSSSIDEHILGPVVVRTPVWAGFRSPRRCRSSAHLRSRRFAYGSVPHAR